MSNLKIAPPWVQYVNALTAMFEKDPEVRVEYNNDEHQVKLYVENVRKAEALEKLLPAEKEFGGVTLRISVIPANLDNSLVALYKEAFMNNRAVVEITTINEPFMSNPVTYVSFKKEVVQYHNDDLSDSNGNRNTLYQEIAKELFEGHREGIFFCTSNRAPFNIIY